MEESVYEILAESADPSIRYLYQRDVLVIDSQVPEMTALQDEIKDCKKVRKLLAAYNEGLTREPPRHAYSKWRGSFWILLQLTEMGYPPGDERLIPLRDQVLDWLLDTERLKRVPLINGRYRRCACQEGTAVLTMIKLGIIDPRIEELVDLLLKWQWPDGGWNCDKKPLAAHASFHETWLPLRAMHAYARLSGDPRAAECAERAGEVFLSRRLFKRLSNGELISEYFMQLAFPAYWHYDILVGLMVMNEIGRLQDPRCAEALDLLESKHLPNGGYAADIKYYRVTETETSGVSPVGWGPVSKDKMNEYVSVRALGVLKQAGRL